jgi:hypothetical protein
VIIDEQSYPKESTKCSAENLSGNIENKKAKIKSP